MASQGRKLNEPNQSPANPTKQMIEMYSGMGKQFKVKFVGCDNVSRKRGDAEAAKYAILSLKNAVKQMKTHKPRAVLGLTLKGLSIFDEQTKNTTRVALQKIIYVAHDCEDLCFFGIIVASKESHTGFKLHCFKAEQKIAVSFVRSSQELFSLLYKLKKAKKQIRERREETSGKEEEDHKDENTNEPSTENVDQPQTDIFDLSTSDSSPPAPPSYSSVTDQPWPSDVSKPSEVDQDRRQKAIDEWIKLESDLTDIAKELNLEDEQKPRPGEIKDEVEHTYAQVKKKGQQELSSKGASDADELEAIFGGMAPQTSTTANQSSAKSQIMFTLNPFQEGSGNQPPFESTAPFGTNFSGQFPNFPQGSSANPSTISPSQAQVEPSIGFDLTELFQAPIGGYQPRPAMDAGNPFSQPVPTFSGQMGGPIGGPMGGLMGGRPMGAPSAAPMGTVFGAQLQTRAPNNPFNAFQNTGAAIPQLSGDILSGTDDTFMQTACAQPLLPEPNLQPGVKKLGANPPPKPEARDAFADLFSMAKSQPKPAPPSSPQVSAPKPSMMEMMQQKEKTENKIGQDMLLAFGEATDSGSQQPQSSVSQQVSSSSSPAAPPPSLTQNWVEFGRGSGNQVTPPTQPTTSSQKNWTSFDDAFGDQFSIPTQPLPPATVPLPANDSSWVAF